jgi:magnesium chelatase family protein
LLDRIDLLVHVQRPTADELRAAAPHSSTQVRAAVLAARTLQADRLEGTGLRTNAEMTAAVLRRCIGLDADAGELLHRAYDDGRLSARGHQRVLRVARTIADLAGGGEVRPEHMVEALSLRQDGLPTVAAAAA